MKRLFYVADNMLPIRKNIIFTLFFSILLLETLSFFTFLYPSLKIPIFIGIFILIFYLTCRQLSYGLIISTAELAIGSFGYLFSLDIFNFSISLRLAIWFIVLFVWFIKILQEPSYFVDILKKYKNIIIPFSVFWIILIFSLINGLRHYQFFDVFYDFNSWLYLFLLFPWLYFNKKYTSLLWEILVTSSIWLFLKTTILLYIFSHQFINLSEIIYHWTRDFRLGEITYAGVNFWRIFLQSQSFVLFVVVVLCAFLFFIKKLNKTKESFFYLLVLLCLLSTLIMSYSRSFWLALLVSLFITVIFSWKILGFKTMIKRLFILSGTAFLSLLLVYFIVNFPFPRISTSGGLITNRLQNISGEAAGSSRLNQLKPLWQGIIQAPLMGSGFGSPITYISSDPRIVAQSVEQSGIYTTYSFEWGYLDIWLKIGLVGLVVYLWLICMLILKTYKNKQLLTLALVFGFMAIIITHVTTPYLNHPLGIGLLFILIACSEFNYETI